MHTGDAITGPSNANHSMNNSIETGSSTVSVSLPSSTSLEGKESKVEVYTRRWWILTVFCATTFTQGLLWNTWSPIGDALLISYGWDASFLALCLCMSSIGVALLAFPFAYCIETRGLRLGLVIATSLLILGTAAWNISLPTRQSWLTVIGSLSCGVVASATFNVATIVSVMWFPVSEQVTATAAMTMSSYIGVGVPFITGPYISGANVTAYDIKHRNQLSAGYKDNLRLGLQNVVYFDSALAVACFIMVMSYFPSRPPKPANVSQTKGRTEFWVSLKKVVRTPQFWLINVTYNLINGAYYSWVPLFAVNFTKSLGVSETTTGWIGFTSTIIGCSSSILISFIMNKFKRSSKKVIICLTIGAVLLLAVLGCIQQGFLVLPSHFVDGTLYALCIVLSICINGVTPLCYELACETTYPAYEGISSTIITISNNLMGPLFYGLFLVPALAADLRWMTWATMGTATLSLPFLLLMKEQYLRLDVESTSPL